MTMSSPQSPASVDDCVDDDESWWIYFRAEGPDGKPASAREELAASQPRKERPVGEANSQCCPAWEREKSSRVAGFRSECEAFGMRKLSTERPSNVGGVSMPANASHVGARST